MRVLLTRAAEDAARTRAVLERRGHEVLLSPVIAIRHLPLVWPSGVIDGLLVTSAQAFRSIDTAGPKPEARRLVPLWLVGRRTEEAGRQAGFQGASTVAANAVALALQLKTLPRASRIVYLAGTERKTDIETALSVTGRAVDLIETYTASPAQALDEAARQALLTHALDVVLHYSRRSAEIFVTLAGSVTSRDVRHICLSGDVAEPLNAAGMNTVTAAEPHEDALLALVR